MSDADLNDEILQLLAQDRKIEAIKRYREATGTGLAQAKSAVELIGAGVRIGEAKRLPITPEQLLEEVLALARQGHYILAIKRYRETTGSQLKEAKEAVDRLCQANGIERPNSSCGGAALFGLLVFLCCAGVAVYLFFGAN